MVHDNVRVDVGAADDIGWDVLHPRVLLDGRMMRHQLAIYSLLGLGVPLRGWDLAGRELLHVLGGRSSRGVNIRLDLVVSIC